MITEQEYHHYSGRPEFTITQPKLSKWKCYLFGGSPAFAHNLVLHIREGQEPNWFWRKMQYLAFGNRWVKDK